MNAKLFIQAIIKYIMGVLLVGALIFIPAGTINYIQGWLLMGILFIPMFIVGLIMMFKSPELLKKRLNAKEEEKDQKLVLALSGIMFISAFVIAGLNYRFEWLLFPVWVSYAGAFLFIMSYIVYGEILRENEYLSRTIEVQNSQKVIDTGFYSVVRHPMYMATIFLFLSMPIILGSLYSFIIMLFYIPIISIRINNEEKVLKKGLKGYSDYMKKVKYKVIPFIW